MFKRGPGVVVQISQQSLWGFSAVRNTIQILYFDLGQHLFGCKSFMIGGECCPQSFGLDEFYGDPRLAGFFLPKVGFVCPKSALVHHQLVIPADM